MNQEKIGKFIAECRKKENLTQQELAEKLDLTYKAVSKWECGKGLPDVSLYEPLCKILKISLNEFFAGQHLKQEEILENSEKNILDIAVEKNRIKSKSNKLIVSLLVVIVLLVAFSIGFYKYMCNYKSTAKTFELNWGITLPNDFKEEYYIDTGASFHGDGQRYSIFTGNNFLTSLKEENNEKLESEISNLYIVLNVPKENQIDFSHQYSWTKIYQENDKSSYIYCILDKEINKFYFYENIL